MNSEIPESFFYPFFRVFRGPLLRLAAGLSSGS
jgi:hypothetical protein